MSKRRFYHVKKRTLLAVAGCVWLVAGINVARLGVLSYIMLPQKNFVHILLSLAVFCAFGFMFYKMSIKHTKRIKGYREEFRPIWHFFDLKAYIIMAVMMGGGFGCVRQDLCPMYSSTCSIRGLAAPLHSLAYCSGLCFSPINLIKFVPFLERKCGESPQTERT